MLDDVSEHRAVTSFATWQSVRYKLLCTVRGSYLSLAVRNATTFQTSGSLAGWSLLQDIIDIQVGLQYEKKSPKKGKAFTKEEVIVQNSAELVKLEDYFFPWNSTLKDFLENIKLYLLFKDFQVPIGTLIFAPISTSQQTTPTPSKEQEIVKQREIHYT